MVALLLDLGWKSALIAGFALLANHLLRRRAPAERVAVLRAALAALLILPVLAFAVPAVEVAVLPALDAAPVMRLTSAAGGVPEAVTREAPAAMPFDGLAALYYAGAALMLVRLAAGLSTLWRWTRGASPVRDPRWTAAMRASPRLRRPVRLLVSRHVAAPMSWGLAPAWVLIGPGTEQRAEQAEAVIAHELAHVRRFDWPVLMAAQLATLVFWFNPLVWLLARELARQTELAADEDALHHVARADYAQTLLSLAGGAAHPAACGMSITHSALGRRICCVLDAEAARPASRLVCAVVLISAPLAAAPLAAMQLVRAAAPVPVAAPVQMTKPTEPAPPPAIETYLPAVVPAARAADAPPVRRARRAPGLALNRSLDAVAAKPRAPLDDRAEAGRIAPRHAGLTPPPPRPPAPGTEAWAWREAIEGGQARNETRTRKLAMHRGEAVARNVKPDEQDLARAMTEAAKGLRVKAQDLEAIAADGSVAREIRGAHARAAGSLRNQADKLDIEARRKLIGG